MLGNPLTLATTREALVSEGGPATAGVSWRGDSVPTYSPRTAVGGTNQPVMLIDGWTSAATVPLASKGALTWGFSENPVISLWYSSHDFPDRLTIG